jgi:lysophospholipase L1-like esterase
MSDVLKVPAIVTLSLSVVTLSLSKGGANGASRVRFLGAVVAAISCALFAALGAAPRVAAQASSSAPIRMTVLGDSLALGTGATDPANAFAFRVYRALLAERPGSEVTNDAIGGSRVADVTRLQVPLLAADADLVLVIVGGNDVVRRTPAKEFAADYSRLLAAARARAPHAALVACGVPDVARSPLFADSYAKTEALALADDRAVRAAARAQRAAFVDLFTLTQTRGRNPDFFSADDFHPSDAGYAQLESVTLPVVERALAKLR